MPFPARRGRVSRRFAGNVGKQGILGAAPPPAGSVRHPEYDCHTEPPRRVPHYEEDPNWVCRAPEGNNSPHYNPTLSYTQQHPASEPHTPPPNPRGSWGPGRKGRGRGRGDEGGGRGWGVRRSDPPLAWSGIPHLEHSFVIQKDSGVGQPGQGGQGGFNVPQGPQNTPNSTHLGQEYRPECAPSPQNPRGGVEVYPDAPGPHLEQGRGAPNQQNPRGGMDTHPSTPKPNTGQGKAESSMLGQKPGWDKATPNTQDPNTNTQANGASDGATGPQNVAAAASGMPRGTKTPAAVPESSARLELETERYYQELLGNKEDKGTPQEDRSISAAQVAQITVECRTVEAERRREEERQREEVERVKRKKEEEEAAWTLLHRLWEFVRNNPYDFDGWTSLLGHVEVMNNTEAMRSAFDGFLPLYPYCFAYWKKLSDMEASLGQEDRALGILLLGTEVVPFCTDLWLPLITAFTSYIRQRGLPENCIRELYEDGLQRVGTAWHSSPLWDAYVTFEQDRGDLVAVMGLYRRLIGTPLRLYNKHWDHFLALVRDHHPHSFLAPEEYQALRKQACEELKMKAMPSLASSATLPSSSSSSSSSSHPQQQQPRVVVKTPQPEDRLTSLIKEKIVASYIKTHEGTEKEVDKRWKFEEKIKRPYFHVKPLDRKRLKNWRDYLDFELLEGDPVRIVTLFERCLVACALYEDIWCKYAEYMERHAQDVADGKYDSYGVSVENGKTKEDEKPQGTDQESGKVKEDGRTKESGKEIERMKESDKENDVRTKMGGDDGVKVKPSDGRLLKSDITSGKVRGEGEGGCDSDRKTKEGEKVRENNSKVTHTVEYPETKSERAKVDRESATLLESEEEATQDGQNSEREVRTDDMGDRTGANDGVTVESDAKVDSGCSEVPGKDERESGAVMEVERSINTDRGSGRSDGETATESGDRGEETENTNDQRTEGGSKAGDDAKNTDVTQEVEENEATANQTPKTNATMETAETENRTDDTAERTEKYESYEEIKYNLTGSLSLSERVLRCPHLTPEWIMRGVTWEDVRQVYRRAAWIHCSGKASILMQWAEFEEVQENVDTARELLVSVIDKHPTLIKPRMQLIELECRAGQYSKVEELYAEASRALTLPRQRAWLAMRYARFLFKTLQEPERALVVLRKALKKDRGNTLLYHHVFDICYQRQPIDVQGVLASTLLALASKDLSLQDKCWFAYKRQEFLKEHGSIVEHKRAQHELASLRLAAERERQAEEKARMEEKEAGGGNVKEEVKEGEEGGGSGDGQSKDQSSSSAVTTTITTGSDGNAALNTNKNTADTTDPNAAAVAAAAAAAAAFGLHQQQQQQFPIPYFSADGAITYTPMAGYGYGHTDPTQPLPTAQEVVGGQGGAATRVGDYHSVPHTWEYEPHSGGYRYDKQDEVRWQEDAKYRQYNELMANGYPSHLRDKQVEEVKAPIKVNIDHLRRRGGGGGGGGSEGNSSRMPDLSQPPPHFSRCPPFTSMGPQGYRMDPLDPRPPGERGPPLLGTPSPHHGPAVLGDPYGKRRLPEDYGREGAEGPPYKTRRQVEENQRLYRAEYDNNYTTSPGPCPPPSHRSTLPPCPPHHPHHHPIRSRDGGDMRPLHPQERRERGVEERRELDLPELARFKETNRYSLRDASCYPSPPSLLPEVREGEGSCYNIPDWLVQDGGELILSETQRGVSVIRYWPSFMTEKGEKTMFRILRQELKWLQQHSLVGGGPSGAGGGGGGPGSGGGSGGGGVGEQWAPLPRLLAWIGPCDLTFDGMTLEKNTQWLPEIVDLLHRLIRYTNNQYNSCLLSLFRGGMDHIGWMAEGHPALRDHPSIATVSLGTTRTFELQRREGRGYLRFPLYPGSLLLMEGATQDDWRHQFPKDPSHPEERIQLSFRKLYMIQGLTV